MGQAPSSGAVPSPPGPPASPPAAPATTAAPPAHAPSPASCAPPPRPSSRLPPPSSSLRLNTKRVTRALSANLYQPSSPPPASTRSLPRRPQPVSDATRQGHIGPIRTRPGSKHAALTASRFHAQPSPTIPSGSSASASASASASVSASASGPTSASLTPLVTTPASSALHGIQLLPVSGNDAAPSSPSARLDPATNTGRRADGPRSTDIPPSFFASQSSVVNSLPPLGSPTNPMTDRDLSPSLQPESPSTDTYAGRSQQPTVHQRQSGSPDFNDYPHQQFQQLSLALRNQEVEDQIPPWVHYQRHVSPILEGDEDITVSEVLQLRETSPNWNSDRAHGKSGTTNSSSSAQMPTSQHSALQRRSKEPLSLARWKGTPPNRPLSLPDRSPPSAVRPPRGPRRHQSEHLGTVSHPTPEPTLEHPTTAKAEGALDGHSTHQPHSKPKPPEERRQRRKLSGLFAPWFSRHKRDRRKAQETAHQQLPNSPPRSGRKSPTGSPVRGTTPHSSSPRAWEGTHRRLSPKASARTSSRQRHLAASPSTRERALHEGSPSPRANQKSALSTRATAAHDHTLSPRAGPSPTASARQLRPVAANIPGRSRSRSRTGIRRTSASNSGSSVSRSRSSSEAASIPTIMSQLKAMGPGFERDRTAANEEEEDWEDLEETDPSGLVSTFPNSNRFKKFPHRFTSAPVRTPSAQLRLPDPQVASLAIDPFSARSRVTVQPPLASPTEPDEPHEALAPVSSGRRRSEPVLPALADARVGGRNDAQAIPMANATAMSHSASSYDAVHTTEDITASLHPQHQHGDQVLQDSARARKNAHSAGETMASRFFLNPPLTRFGGDDQDTNFSSYPVSASDGSTPGFKSAYDKYVHAISRGRSRPLPPRHVLEHGVPGRDNPVPPPPRRNGTRKASILGGESPPGLSSAAPSTPQNLPNSAAPTPQLRSPWPTSTAHLAPLTSPPGDSLPVAPPAPVLHGSASGLVCAAPSSLTTSDESDGRVLSSDLPPGNWYRPPALPVESISPGPDFPLHSRSNAEKGNVPHEGDGDPLRNSFQGLAAALGLDSTGSLAPYAHQSPTFGGFPWMPLPDVRLTEPEEASVNKSSAGHTHILFDRELDQGPNSEPPSKGEQSPHTNLSRMSSLVSTSTSQAVRQVPFPEGAMQASLDALRALHMSQEDLPHSWAFERLMGRKPAASSRNKAHMEQGDILAPRFGPDDPERLASPLKTQPLPRAPKDEAGMYWRDRSGRDGGDKLSCSPRLYRRAAPYSWEDRCAGSHTSHESGRSHGRSYRLGLEQNEERRRAAVSLPRSHHFARIPTDLWTEIGSLEAMSPGDRQHTPTRGGKRDLGRPGRRARQIASTLTSQTGRSDLPASFSTTELEELASLIHILLSHKRIKKLRRAAAEALECDKQEEEDKLETEEEKGARLPLRTPLQQAPMPHRESSASSVTQTRSSETSDLNSPQEYLRDRSSSEDILSPLAAHVNQARMDSSPERFTIPSWAVHRSVHPGSALPHDLRRPASHESGPDPGRLADSESGPLSTLSDTQGAVRSSHSPPPLPLMETVGTIPTFPTTAVDNPSVLRTKVNTIPAGNGRWVWQPEPQYKKRDLGRDRRGHERTHPRTRTYPDRTVEPGAATAPPGRNTKVVRPPRHSEHGKHKGDAREAKARPQRPSKGRAGPDRYDGGIAPSALAAPSAPADQAVRSGAGRCKEPNGAQGRSTGRPKPDSPSSSQRSRPQSARYRVKTGSRPRDGRRQRIGYEHQDILQWQASLVETVEPAVAPITGAHGDPL